MRIETVYKANRIYFHGGNKRLFGDIDYSTIESASGKSYFLNHTNMFSGMFGGKKTPCYRLSTLNQLSGEIRGLMHPVFADMQEVETYLETR